MRFCVIKDCTSKDPLNDRSLFELVNIFIFKVEYQKSVVVLVRKFSCYSLIYHYNRTIFRIKGEDRRAWKSLIQTHQQIDDKKAIYICDLHFCQQDLIRNGKSVRPKKNVLPFLRYIRPIKAIFCFLNFSLCPTELLMRAQSI